MNDNKLIATFMGMGTVKDGVVFEFKENDELHYHESWDALMPVVQKCYETEVTQKESYLTLNMFIGLPYMEPTYNAVVGFINEYNKTNRYD